MYYFGFVFEIRVSLSLTGGSPPVSAPRVLRFTDEIYWEQSEEENRTNSNPAHPEVRGKQLGRTERSTTERRLSPRAGPEEQSWTDSCRSRPVPSPARAHPGELTTQPPVSLKSRRKFWESCFAARSPNNLMISRMVGNGGRRKVPSFPEAAMRPTYTHRPHAAAGIFYGVQEAGPWRRLPASEATLLGGETCRK